MAATHKIVQKSMVMWVSFVKIGYTREKQIEVIIVIITTSGTYFYSRMSSVTYF